MLIPIFRDAADLFDSTEEQLEFMDDFGFDAGRKLVLKELNQFSVAAESHLRDGEIEDAIACFLRSKERAGQNRAVGCILGGLWTQAFGAELSDRSRGLLTLAEGIPPDHISSEEQHQVSADPIRSFCRY